MIGRKRELNSISAGVNFLLNAMFLFCVVLCVAPLILVVSTSFTKEMEILLHGYNFIPREFSTKSYEFILKGGVTIWRAYGVSIFVTVVGTVLAMMIICMYAYPLSRQGFRYKSLFAFLAYFTMIFGGGLVPWYMVYTHLVPIKDSVWILIVPYLMNAWYVLIMRTFIKTTVNESIIESARIDGAGEFRTFFVIVMPLCKAGLATIGLFCTLGYWNDWYLPLVFLNEPKLYNIQFLMFQTLMSIQFLSSGGNFSGAATALGDLPSEGARMAIAVISIGPIVFAYPFFQKYFIKGLTVGAVKG
ncbi:MAG: carbohydrate ABC transporter permease [Bacillota bacterium]